MFLPPDQPLHSCTYGKCDSCDISGRLVCHFGIGHLLRFLLLSMPTIILGGVAVFRFNPLFLIPWFAMYIAFFGFIEIKALCSHCPHYGEPGLKSLKCWANYGAPKLWKYKPGPMSVLEKATFFIGVALIFSYPVPFLVLQKSYILLGVYPVLFAVGMFILKTLYCPKCINFACPMNRVPAAVRESFFDKNPMIKRAWKS